MKINLLLDILYNATIASLIATEFVQFLKSKLKIKNIIIFTIVEFIIGFFYSYSFVKSNFIFNIWCGLFVVIGAENLYQILKGKLGLKSSNK